MIPAIIIGLSVASAALAIYALWPWAMNRSPKAVYRGGVVGLAVVILVGPGLAYYSSQENGKAAAPVDLSALSLGIDDAGTGSAGFVWDGPVAAGNPDPHDKDMSLEAVTERLARKLEAQPDNRQGWVLLGRSYAALGNIAKAREVFGDILARWPDDTEVRVAYGEMLMAAAGGRITTEARQAFEAAAAIDPGHARAQYDLALADSQEGNHQAAYDRWLSLARTAEPGAPWLTEVAARLKETAAELGIKAPDMASAAPAAATPNPSAEDVNAAMAMSPADRQAFIRSMVDGLADRLKRNPNDLQGWLRLGRSYGVLGERDNAEAAYRDALKAFPANPDLTRALTDISSPD